MKTCLITILLFSASIAFASETELHLGRFSAGDMTGWKEQTIGVMKPKVTYGLTRDNDRTVLIAHSAKAASGQIYSLNLDPKEYQTLKWSWKVEHIIKKGNEKTKEGEDFAARVYVVFPRGFFSRTRSICYVWANRLPKGEHIPSPFTPNIITVAVDSGEELVGRWTSHQRNIYEDYRQFFGEEPPKIGAVAVMTDTDNTGETAIAYYGDISLLHTPKAPDTKQKDAKPKESPPKDIRQKDTPVKVPGGGGDTQPAPAEPARPVRPADEPLKKEQPAGAKSIAPPAAPQPAVIR